MFPGLTELHLIGCLIEFIWIPRSKSSTSLADILTKGNFTRDEWNHLLSLFNISHFSSTVCSAAMAKRSQQDSGEERVTAKSRPMMNLIARTPSFVSSSTSVSPEKKHYGNQDPWKSVAGEDRSGRLDKGTDLFEASDHYYHEQFMESFSSTEYSKLDYDHVNRVNDQVRKRQNISNVAGEGEEHCIIWRMLMAVTLESATFMGKNFQDNRNPIVNTADLTLKQMFDKSAKLVAEQDEISNLETIGWEKHSWKYRSLLGDERITNLERAKVRVFSDSVLCLGKIHQHPNANESWKNRIEWITTSQSYRDYDGINGEPTEFEWNIFPGFTTLQLCGKVTDLLSRLGETPETFTGRILFMSMFNDISCYGKGNEEECVANAKVVSIVAKKFGIGQWSSIGPGSEKKWYSMKEDSPQGIWDHIAEKMLLEFAESTCPIFRAAIKLSRGQFKSKGHGKLSIHFAADQKTIQTVFRIIVSANQLNLYGAVANMCEECESLHDRSGQPDKVMGQSIVVSEIKTEVPLENDDPAFQNFVLQQYEERIERFSQQDKVSKFCMDAGFMSVVEIRQYFMTKDTGEQFYAVACREYTLPRDDGSSQPRGWIKGNTKIGPVLEVTTSYLYGKYGVEIIIWSLSEDNTHTWVRISHGSKIF